MAQDSAFTLLSSTRQTARNPSFLLKNSQDSFGTATVFELGIEPGAGVIFLSMTTSGGASGGHQPAVPDTAASRGASARCSRHRGEWGASAPCPRRTRSSHVHDRR